jgi:hypothetical protein
LQDTVSINELLAPEVAEANRVLDRGLDTLKEIYIRAAVKIVRNGLVSDPHDACAMLRRVFSLRHNRHITDCLPEQYKRTYVQEEDWLAPSNLYQEALKLIYDVMQGGADAALTLYKKLKATEHSDAPEDKKKYDSIMIILEQQFGGTAEVRKFIARWMELMVEVTRLKENEDERQKIGYLEKFRLRIELLFFNKDHVAKKIDLSSKWIKNMKIDDEEIIRARDELRRCPFCLRDIADWFQKQRIRAEKGFPLEEPPIHVLKARPRS